MTSQQGHGNEEIPIDACMFPILFDYSKCDTEVHFLHNKINFILKHKLSLCH